jgi:hypothetical protein
MMERITLPLGTYFNPAQSTVQTKQRAAHRLPTT